MKFIASLIGLLFLLAAPYAARADTCTVPGHPTCTITCPSNQQCEAKWVSTYGGACAKRCVPKPPGPQISPKIVHGPGGIQPNTGKVTEMRKAGGEQEKYSHEIVSPRDPQSGLPTGKRMHKPYEPKVYARSGKRCRSQAYDKEEAEKFCRKELDCPVTCQGDSMARRWVCWCS